MSGFHLGGGRGWLLPSLGTHTPTVTPYLELLGSTINKGPYLSLYYHMDYSLAIPYSAKTQFCHPLSQCLNETLHVYTHAYNYHRPLKSLNFEVRPIIMYIHVHVAQVSD